MIYELVRYWIKEVMIAYLNSSIVDATLRLREIDTTLDIGFTPTSLKDKSYLIKFGDIEPINTEVKEYKVSITIEFQFLIAKSSLGNYKKNIDNYLFPLLDSFWNKEELEYHNAGISTTLALDDIDNVKLSGLDKTDKGGTYILPELTFELTFVKSN